MKDPVLTVIIPYFNTAETLETLLYSVGMHEDMEVIVIDDRSDENLGYYGKIRKEFSDHVTFLTNTHERKSAGAARNMGLENAHGKWILFADADDFFLEGWFDGVRKYFGSDDDIVYFLPESINVMTGEKGERSERYRRMCRNCLLKKKGAERKLRYGFRPPWSKLYRRGMLLQNNISFEEVRCYNDVLFSVKAGFFAEKIAVAEESIYCVTKRKQSLTNDFSEASELARMGEECKIYLFSKENGIREGFSAPATELRKAAKNRVPLRIIRKSLAVMHEYNVPLMNMEIFLSCAEKLAEKIKNRY